jgi:hypothetical protein
MELPPSDVVPLPELETDLSLARYLLEAERLEQVLTCIVGERDAGERIDVAAFMKVGKKRSEQLASNATSLVTRRDVDRDLHRPAVRGARMERRRVRVTLDFSFALGHKPSEAVSYAGANVVETRQAVLERGVTAGHERAVDVQYGTGIGARGPADLHLWIIPLVTVLEQPVVGLSIRNAPAGGIVGP